MKTVLCFECDWQTQMPEWFGDWLGMWNCPECGGPVEIIEENPPKSVDTEA